MTKPNFQPCSIGCQCDLCQAQRLCKNSFLHPKILFSKTQQQPKQEAVSKGKASRRTIGKIHRRHAGTMMPRIIVDVRTKRVCKQESGRQHQTRVALGTATPVRPVHSLVSLFRINAVTSLLFSAAWAVISSHSNTLSATLILTHRDSEKKIKQKGRLSLALSNSGKRLRSWAMCPWQTKPLNIIFMSRTVVSFCTTARCTETRARQENLCLLYSMRARVCVLCFRVWKTQRRRECTRT